MDSEIRNALSRERLGGIAMGLCLATLIVAFGAFFVCPNIFDLASKCTGPIRLGDRTL